MAYNELVTADLRLVALQALEQDPDYSHNEHVLLGVLASLGHGVSTDRLRTELEWLSEQGLVSIEDVHGLWVVSLTRRGGDVACGRAHMHGVKRPRPGR